MHLLPQHAARSPYAQDAQGPGLPVSRMSKGCEREKTVWYSRLPGRRALELRAWRGPAVPPSRVGCALVGLVERGFAEHPSCHTPRRHWGMAR